MNELPEEELEKKFQAHHENSRFNTWKVKTLAEIETVANLLNKELSDDATKLENETRIIESHNYRLSALCCEAAYWLAVQRAENLGNCTEGTVFENEINMENLTRDIEVIYAKLKYLAGSDRKEGVVSKRISLGQSFLSGHRARMKNLGE